MPVVIYVIIMVITSLIIEVACKKIEKLYKEVLGDFA